MSPIPWLPAGQAELPASRFVVFADDTHRLLHLDESVKTLIGVSFVGVWESGSLNGDTILEKTLQLLTIMYSASVATTITVKASGDGGKTWKQSRVATITATTDGEVKRLRLGFNVTGFDIRIRIELDTDQIVSIFELHPQLAIRGEHNVEQFGS